MAELGETKTTSWREPEHRSLFDRLPGLLYIAWGPLAILVALAGCCYATVHNADTMLTFLPFLLLSFPAFGVRSSVRLTPRLMERWEHQHGGSATFPVCMTPRQGDLMLGRDQGLLSFVDGYLEYEGERSTFRIAPQDVSSVQNGPVLPEHALWVGRGYAYDLEIRLSGTEQRSVLLRQHRVHNSWDPPSVERLQNAVAAWAKTEHIEQAATELPPLEPTHLARQDCRYPLWCSAVYVATLAWMGLVAWRMLHEHDRVNYGPIDTFGRAVSWLLVVLFIVAVAYCAQHTFRLHLKRRALLRELRSSRRPLSEREVHAS